MGGYGALKAAFARPEQYGICCALSSGSLFMKDWLDDVRKDKKKSRDFYGQMITDLEGMFGEDLVCKDEDDLLTMAKKSEKSLLRPDIYMSCGTEDYLRDLNQQFAKEMEKLSYNFTYEEISGAHDWCFFDEALKRALEWITKR